ncbi:MAG: hypothetical protein WAM85_04530 [Terracidiphilus sp.]
MDSRAIDPAKTINRLAMKLTFLTTSPALIRRSFGAIVTHDTRDAKLSPIPEREEKFTDETLDFSSSLCISGFMPVSALFYPARC